MAEQDADLPHADGDPSGLARVRELLPWYAAQVLPAAEQAWVAQWLESGPPEAVAALRAEIAWLQSAAVAVAAPPLPPAQIESGLNRLMQRIAADGAAHGVGLRAAAAAAARSTSRPPGLLQRWVSALSDWLAPRGPGLAMAAIAVFLIQAGVIGVLLQKAPVEQVPLSGGAPQTVAADRVVLLVAFRSSATEAGLRALLLQHQAQIIAGPSAMGLYRVAVPTAQAATIAAALRQASTLVESVQQE